MRVRFNSWHQNVTSAVRLTGVCTDGEMMERWGVKKNPPTTVTVVSLCSSIHPRIHYWCLRLSPAAISVLLFTSGTAGGSYTEEWLSVGVRMGVRERERGSLFPWQLVLQSEEKKGAKEKEMYFFQCGSFITQKNCSTDRRPQRAWQRLCSDPNNRGWKDSAATENVSPYSSFNSTGEFSLIMSQ